MSSAMEVILPDLATRTFRLVVGRDMAAQPGALYHAWTVQFDRWFATPGRIMMRPEVEVSEPFFFWAPAEPRPW